MPEIASPNSNTTRDGTCGLAVMVLMHNRIQGMGQKPLCMNCEKLNNQEARDKSFFNVVSLFFSRHV